MAYMKYGKSMSRINEQADLLVERSNGNDARIGRINEIRNRYIDNMVRTANHRRLCQERDMYFTKRDVVSRHKYFEVCRRIENYVYGFVQYSHIQSKNGSKKRVKLVSPKFRTDEALKAMYEENGVEIVGRDALKEMRAIVKNFTRERTEAHKKKSVLNKEHRSVVYKRRKQQMIDNGEIKERNDYGVQKRNCT